MMVSVVGLTKGDVGALEPGVELGREIEESVRTGRQRNERVVSRLAGRRAPGAWS